MTEELKKKALRKYEELTFTDDFIFCKVMQNNEKLCKELLELILGKKIIKITFPESQKTIEIASDGKGVRLDIYVVDEEMHAYDVEMQTVLYRNLPKRSRYYQGIHELPGMELEDESEKIFLCAGGTENDVSEEMRQFLDYLAKGQADSRFTQEIEEAVENAKRQKEWRREYMTLQMRDMENREIGREEGREEGREKGREEGIELGISALILDNIEEGISMARIREKLQKRFDLTANQAEEYVGKYAAK